MEVIPQISRLGKVYNEPSNFKVITKLYRFSYSVNLVYDYVPTEIYKHVLVQQCIKYWILKIANV